MSVDLRKPTHTWAELAKTTQKDLSRPEGVQTQSPPAGRWIITAPLCHQAWQSDFNSPPLHDSPFSLSPNWSFTWVSSYIQVQTHREFRPCIVCMELLQMSPLAFWFVLLYFNLYYVSISFSFHFILLKYRTSFHYVLIDLILFNSYFYRMSFWCFSLSTLSCLCVLTVLNK